MRDFLSGSTSKLGGLKGKMVFAFLVFLMGCGTLLFDNQKLESLLYSKKPDNAGLICGEIVKFLYSNSGPLTARVVHKEIEVKTVETVLAKANVEFSRSGHRSGFISSRCKFSLNPSTEDRWIILVDLETGRNDISDRHVESLNKYMQALMKQ